MTDIRILANLSSQAYLSVESAGYAQGGNEYIYLDHTTDISLSDNLQATGFGAHSFYSTQDNTLVIAYAGTAGTFDSADTGLDIWADLQLAVTGYSVQNSQAITFANQQIAAAQAIYGDDILISFTGHSLGGYLAQYVIQEFEIGNATVFNSPGVGGLIGTDASNNNVTYVYSDPSAWGIASVIHNLADILSDDVYFVQSADGHSLLSIQDALNNGELPLSAEQWGAILAEGLRTGEIQPSEAIGLIGAYNDIIRDTVIRSLIDSGTGCFAAGTIITMADGSEKLIEDITPDDWVTSYDKNGDIVPGRVTATETHTVQHLLDVFGLMVTPGHVTFCGDGRFAGRHVPIIDILRTDGALVRVDGTNVRACTGCVVGSSQDGFVQAIAGDLQSSGQVEVREANNIRVGTRIILSDGRDISVNEIIEAGGGVVLPDGLIATVACPEGMPFHWTFSDHLPSPESYIMERSKIFLPDIYVTNEWDDMLPILPAPVQRRAETSKPQVWQ